jgi:hypothetical protein
VGCRGVVHYSDLTALRMRVCSTCSIIWGRLTTVGASHTAAGIFSSSDLRMRNIKIDFYSLISVKHVTDTKPLAVTLLSYVVVPCY